MTDNRASPWMKSAHATRDVARVIVRSSGPTGQYAPSHAMVVSRRALSFRGRCQFRAVRKAKLGLATLACAQSTANLGSGQSGLLALDPAELVPKRESDKLWSRLSTVASHAQITPRAVLATNSCAQQTACFQLGVRGMVVARPVGTQCRYGTATLYQHLALAEEHVAQSSNRRFAVELPAHKTVCCLTGLNGSPVHANAEAASKASNAGLFTARGTEAALALKLCDIGRVAPRHVRLIASLSGRTGPGALSHAEQAFVLAW